MRLEFILQVQRVNVVLEGCTGIIRVVGTRSVAVIDAGNIASFKVGDAVETPFAFGVLDEQVEDVEPLLVIAKAE